MIHLRQKYNEAYKRADKKHALMPYRRFTKGKSNAKQGHRVWEIEFADYERLIKFPCTYCGKSLDDQRGASLDRINNALGYTLNNVLPCCRECNCIRMNHLTVEETKVVVKALLEYRNRPMDVK